MAHLRQQLLHCLLVEHGLELYGLGVQRQLHLTIITLDVLENVKTSQERVEVEAEAFCTFTDCLIVSEYVHEPFGFNLSV